MIPPLSTTPAWTLDLVTDNKDDSGRYLMESEGIGFDFKGETRPSEYGLIAYNGHAGLGGNAHAYQLEPTTIEYPNIAVVR